MLDAQTLCKRIDAQSTFTPRRLSADSRAVSRAPGQGSQELEEAYVRDDPAKSWRRPM